MVGAYDTPSNGFCQKCGRSSQQYKYLGVSRSWRSGSDNYKWLCNICQQELADIKGMGFVGW